MNHYTFPDTFRTLYTQAVSTYASGQRGADTFFDADATAWLKSNGLTAQYLYDYAEDENGYNGEPGFDHALSIELVRRDYFLNVQKGVASNTVAAADAWPAKDAALEGITWLPRILAKARAKLRGELPSSFMYGCAGDRKFLKASNILPAELLSVVWRAGDDDQAVLAWVQSRRA